MSSCSSVQSCSWTREENKKFECALALDGFYESDNPRRWEKIAAVLPGKTLEEIQKHYMDLVYDINIIEAGLIEPPAYMDDHNMSMKKHLGKRYSTDGTSGRWDENEHRKFLQGLEEYGKGRWAAISRKFVPTKNPMQVATHAQKYFLRQGMAENEKKRASIFDITTKDVK